MHKIFEEDILKIINSNLDFAVLNNKSVLVTGANGMLASYIVMVILFLNINYNYNIKLLVVVRNKNKFINKFNDLIKENINNIMIYEMDVNDITENTFKNIDINYIIHAASPSQSNQFLEKPLNVIYPNVFVTEKLLNISLNKTIESFLYFSSCDIYGKIQNGYIIENRYGELDPLEARSVYGESKRMAETLCKAYFNQYNTPIKIARIAHTYGPTMELNNDTRVFAEFVKNIVNNENIIMKSDGTAVRPFCYIVDATIAFFKILFNGKNGEAYNVANNKEIISINELVNILINMYPEKNLKALIEKQQDNYLNNKNIDSLKNLFIDTKKLESLNWSPEYNIKTGFKRVIDYFENKKKDKNEKN